MEPRRVFRMEAHEIIEYIKSSDVVGLSTYLSMHPYHPKQFLVKWDLRYIEKDFIRGIEIIDILLAHGASYEKIDAVHGYRHVIQLEKPLHFIKAMADRGFQSKWVESNGRTSLHQLRCVQDDNLVEKIQWFCQNGSRLDHPSILGETPMDQVIQFHSVSIWNCCISMLNNERKLQQYTAKHSTYPNEKKYNKWMQDRLLKLDIMKTVLGDIPQEIVNIILVGFSPF